LYHTGVFWVSFSAFDYFRTGFVAGEIFYSFGLSAASSLSMLLKFLIKIVTSSLETF